MVRTHFHLLFVKRDLSNITSVPPGKEVSVEIRKDLTTLDDYLGITLTIRRLQGPGIVVNNFALIAPLPLKVGSNANL